MAASDLNVDSAERFEKHLIAGGELLRQNRVRESRDEFARALEIKPDEARALALLGLACFRMGDFSGALPVYQKLVAINRNEASYWLNLGLIHLKLNDTQSAIRELTRSRELDPSQSRAVSYLGLAHARRGDYAQAYLAFLQAGESDLAREMEQYLTPEQRSHIQAAIAGPRSTDRPTKRPTASPSPASETSPRDTRLEAEDVEDIDEDSILIEGVDAAGQNASSSATAGHRIPPIPGTSGKTKHSGLPAVVQPSSLDGTVQTDAHERGVISLAVEQAVPSSAAAAGATRTAIGHNPPMSLSEFATARLIRPEDGDHTFETSAGGVLIIRVQGRVYSRTEGVNVTGGQLAYEVASRHVRGSSTGQDFSTDGRQLFIVSGHGQLIAAPLGEHFSAVALDDDILYLREDLVFAFGDQLRWENGHVPGSRSSISMVQFRGRGEVAFRSRRPLLAIKLAPERVLYVDAQALAGWIGRVVPRAVAPVEGGEQSALFVECTGEGVVLVEEEEGGADGRSRSGVAGIHDGGASSSAGSS